MEHDWDKPLMECTTGELQERLEETRKFLKEHRAWVEERGY